MKIIIGFSRAKSPWKIGSKVIQLVEKRPFSHAYMKYTSSYTKVDLVSQASHGMVNCFNYDIFLEDNVVVEEYEFECSDEQFKVIKTFIDSNIGKPYSRMQLVWIGVKKILHIQPKIENGDAAFICSEWAKRICEVAGIIIKSEDDYITPSDLNTLIKSKH